MALPPLVAAFPAAVALACAACAATPAPRDQPAASHTVRFEPSDADLLNPERGTYRTVNLHDPVDLDAVRRRGHSLAFATIRLDPSSDALPTRMLASLHRALDEVRARRLKLILRFAYNDGPVGAPDAPEQRVLRHIGAIEPLLRQQADVIAVLQAGFIGAWGEWHGSTAGLDNNASRATVLRRLLAALPSDRMVQIRRPQFKAAILGSSAPLTASDAFNGRHRARVGHHNDCFLADATDMGTYPVNAVAQWARYVAQETRFVPMGGETCRYNPDRVRCSVATAELARLHYSYLNAEYHPRVIEHWRGPRGCWREIQRKLGYRLVLKWVSFTSPARIGAPFTVRVSLVNVGYAAPFNPRPIFLVLDGAGQPPLQFHVPVDPRRWEPGPTTFEQTFVLPAAMKPGRYRLGLALPDPAPLLREIPEYAIRFANAGTWDPRHGFNIVAAGLQVQR
jgi:hypothetical protein